MVGGGWETEKVCHWERGIWSPEFKEDLFALVQKIVYQRRQHNRDNQRTKRTLIRLQDITQYGCWNAWAPECLTAQ